MCAQHIPDGHVANVLGAFGLALSDEASGALAGAVEEPFSVAAGVCVIGTWGAGSTVQGLARALGLTHSRAVRVADRLEEEGWARRTPSPTDAREVQLWPTRAGRRTAERLLAARAATTEAWLAPLDDVERAELGRLVDKMLEARTPHGLVPTFVCRICDAEVCGHPERCPVTRGAGH